MEDENQDELGILQDAIQLIRDLEVKIAKLNASLFVVRTSLCETLGPEASKAIAYQEAKAEEAAVGAGHPETYRLLVRVREIRQRRGAK